MRHADSKLFGGRILIETLVKEADAQGRFRNVDDRGEVALIAAHTNLEFVEVAEFNKVGVKRGFHFHNNFIETLYVISGQLKVMFKEIQSGEQKTTILNAGDVVTIKPGIAHAFIALEKSIVNSMGHGGAPFVDRNKFDDFEDSE